MTDDCLAGKRREKNESFKPSESSCWQKKHDMSIITVLQLLNKSEAAWKHFAILNRTMCRNCFVKTMMTNLCTSSNLINLNDPCRPNSRTATVFTWIFLKFTQYHLFVFWTEPFHMIFLGIGYLGGKCLIRF